MAVVSFFVLGLWLTGFHETWRDEYQAWLIADTASSLSELATNHKYEGQPILWHLLLWILSKAGIGFGGIKIFHIGISALTVGLIWRFAPFSPVVKLLLSLSYYQLFEFTLIVRPYGLTFLFLVIFCILYRRKERSSAGLALCIAVVANTQTYGVVLAGWLSLLWIARMISEKNSIPFRAWITGSSIIVSAFFIALCSVYPEPDNGFINSGKFTLEAWKILEVFDNYLRSYFPVPRLDKVLFWNSNVIDVLPRVVCGFAGAVLMAVWIAAFRKDKKIMVAVVIGTGLFLILNYWLFQYPFPRNYRHSGHFFMVLLACCWLWRANKNSGSGPIGSGKYLQYGMMIILAVQCVAALLCIQKEIKYPFSNSKAASAFISGSEFAGLPILNKGDAELTSIAGALDERIFYLNRNAYGTFAIWKKFEEVTDQQLYDRINTFLKENEHEKCIYIATGPVEGWENHLIASFDALNATKEGFYIYLLGRDLR